MPSLGESLQRYMAATLNGNECPVIEAKVVEDHAHILFLLDRKRSLADAVEEVKKKSSKWAKQQDPSLADFYWQSGYGAFSVSQSNMGMVQRYILQQDKHHAKLSFQDEFRILLKKHEIEWDERYVWE